MTKMTKYSFYKILFLGVGLCVIPNLPLEVSAYSGGDGSQTSPYLISTPEDLNQLRLEVSNSGGQYYKLINSIDLSEFDTDNDSKNGNWTPIGGRDDSGLLVPFEGYFNGNGYSIQNMTITLETTDYIGLFGYVKGGSITNLTLEAVNLTGNRAVGGLVGEAANNTSISNIQIGGRVYARNTNTGGVVGYLNNSTIHGAHSTASVSTSLNMALSTSMTAYTGGLVGNASSSNISNSSTKGSVGASVASKGSTSERANIYVGGLTGHASSNSVIKDSFSESTISVSGAVASTIYLYMGGLAGDNDGIIENSYATGNGSAPLQINRTYAGGLVGYNKGAISSSYSTGRLRGSGMGVDKLGGLVGYNDGSSSQTATIEKSYWDRTTSGYTTGYNNGSNGSANSVSGLDTQYMKGVVVETRMKNLNFQTTWDATNEGYPALKWENRGIVYTPPVIHAQSVQVFLGDDFDETTHATAEDMSGTPLTVTVENSDVVLDQPGTYHVTYRAEDARGLVTEKTITVTIVENKAPILYASDLRLPIGEDFIALDHVSARDDFDATDGLIIEITTPPFSTDQSGTYDVTYRVEDSRGLVAEKTIKVTIFKKPVIQATNLVTSLGKEINLLDNVTALDEEGNQLEVNVLKTNLNLKIPGSYSITYEAEDLFGYQVVETVTIEVLPQFVIPTETIKPDVMNGSASFDVEDYITSRPGWSSDWTLTILDNPIIPDQEGTYEVIYEITTGDGTKIQETVELEFKFPEPESPDIPETDQDSGNNNADTEGESGNENGFDSNSGITDSRPQVPEQEESGKEEE